MTSFKDWVFSQVISNTIGYSRPLSASETLISQETQNEELECQGLGQSDNMTQQMVFSVDLNSEKTLSPIDKVEALKIKFFRLLRRLNLSQNNLTVAKTLYRIHLATLIRTRKSDLKTANFGPGSAQAIAAKQEELGIPELDFSIKILVLGKTGVGKSSTINSVFGDMKVKTNAFQPATDRVHEIVGVINGIKISFIDTPGLLPSSANSECKNRKTLLSIKHFIRKSPPDVVLYFERLDLINTGYCDLPLLKLITKVLGPPIWFCTNIVMTHSCSALPEDGNGYPLSYDPFVSYCTEVVQRHIHEAIFDAKLENPVILVENHPYCKVDISGKKILPNGQRWIPQFMLLCICTKILGDINELFDFSDSIQLGAVANIRLPSLPHLLSSFLKHRVKLSSDGADSEMEEFSFSELEVEDEEYDELPPIKILTKAQFQKLSPSQKKEYLDELDYRETLFMKKHMKQEYIRRKKENNNVIPPDDDVDASPEAITLPDMALPLSFDSDSPAYRYRCLVRGDQWLARPVLDPHGWDHDVGFDGINIESATEVRKHFLSCIAGQLSKEKQEFNIQCESTAAFLDSRGPTYSLGLDLQSANKGLICTFRGNTKAKTFKSNVTECGISVMSFGDKYYYGAKIEDSIFLSKNLKFKLNFGGISAGVIDQIAYGGNFEASLNGKDYPVRREKLSISMSVLSYEKEMVFGGNIQTDFRLTRGTNVTVAVNTNNRKTGQMCLKVSSSDHTLFAVVAVMSMFFQNMLRKMSKNHKHRNSKEKTVTGQ